MWKLEAIVQERKEEKNHSLWKWLMAFNAHSIFLLFLARSALQTVSVIGAPRLERLVLPFLLTSPVLSERSHESKWPPRKRWPRLWTVVESVAPVLKYDGKCFTLTSRKIKHVSSSWHEARCRSSWGGIKGLTAWPALLSPGLSSSSSF